jgi:hypothetical protein
MKLRRWRRSDYPWAFCDGWLEFKEKARSMTGTLTFLTILFLVILSLVVWCLIQIGIRIGSVKAATDIAKGLITHLDLKPQSEGDGEEIGTDEIFTEFAALHRRDFFYEDAGGREIIMEGIGRALADAAEAHGFAAGREWNAPKAEELSVTMKKEDLSHIAWLANYGLRVWTDPLNDYFSPHSPDSASACGIKAAIQL